MGINTNPKRRQPTSGDSLIDLIRAVGVLVEQVADLEKAATRHLPAGWYFEQDETGPVIVDAINNRRAALSWAERQTRDD